MLINFYRKIINSQEHFSDKQRVIFFKQLAVVLNSGIPILRGMELMQQRTHGVVAQVCKDISVSLCAGMSLATAMASAKKIFPPLVVALVAAGEKSGDLNCVLAELAMYYGKQAELKQFLFKSALYPFFLLCSSCCVLIFFVLYVLPMLAEVYTSMGAVPNAFLQSVVVLKNFLLAYGKELAVLGTAVIIWLISKRKELLYLTYRLPFVCKLAWKVQEVCFCKILALLLERGINITEAVDAATVAISDYKLRGQLQLFASSLKHDGDILTATKKLAEVFTPLTLELMNIGAETGYLPQMLNEAANILEMDLRERLERLQEIFAPLLLLLAALVAGVVICSVVAPLFDLFTALPEYK